MVRRRAAPGAAGLDRDSCGLAGASRTRVGRPRRSVSFLRRGASRHGRLRAGLLRSDRKQSGGDADPVSPCPGHATQAVCAAQTRSGADVEWDFRRMVQDVSQDLALAAELASRMQAVDPLALHRFSSDQAREMVRQVAGQIETYLRAGKRAGKTTEGAFLGTCLARGMPRVDGRTVREARDGMPPFWIELPRVRTPNV